MNLDFMPSRRLALYMVKLMVSRSLAVLVALVLVLLMLDLLGESGKILAVEGNGEADLWRYAGLRLPMLVSRFLPFSVLLGCLIAFAGLNQHSEVISMKAAGLSAHQILAPLIIAAAGLGALLFAFNEAVVVDSARVINAWKDSDYEPIPPDTGVYTNVWLAQDGTLVHARQASGRGPDFQITDLTLYEREAGTVARIVEADRALPHGDRWMLEGVRRYDAGMNLVTETARETALPGIGPAQFRLAKVDPEALDIVTLGRTIADLEAAQLSTTAARAGWWHKITGPVSTILMPLLAAVAAFGLARSGQLLLRAVIGMALGFAYFVADNFSLAMGNAGVYSPMLATWGPVILFAALGEAILIRSEE
ncbi:LPS export ABC transporter permease LptG [Sphingomicrobium astaxanthinifaciens]|uniref:LPS export ABC transporter permease LptG n=1 Tax=Sphingomicrobium astaxanthinifaciens TaxID=1227949 RepID=UPI001FCA5A98|nr:LPS export ABC transporter permease LptG [Sphingomicrobium astaxanthinifaciens]MCJ7420812.1 LPS export ABC transporter permease LptG [Sphingomicrobium astaxanthinifaciens]